MNEVIINNNFFKVLTVISPKDIQRGMMGRRFNNDFNGMLFIMDPGKHSFWMKDCIISLDIIFIKNLKVVKIFKNCPPCKTEDCQNYEADGDMVLEIAGGDCDKYDIVVGDDMLIS
jgi:uncharacterized membrane protein (UPF0127 family)